MKEDEVMVRILETRRRMWEECGEDLERYLDSARRAEGRIRREEGPFRFHEADVGTRSDLPHEEAE